MANQFSNRPRFCDFLERYLAANKPRWSKSQLLGSRVGVGRFDEWLKVCPYTLKDLTWQRLLDFHRFLALQGTSAYACKKSIQAVKRALRWGIEAGELPQKLEDIYTFHYPRNNWDVELPPLSREFLSGLEPTRPGSFKTHRYCHRVFHTFLAERHLTYRRLKIEHFVAYAKFLKKKDFELHTREIMSRQVRAYLLWLYSHKEIKRHPDEIFPLHLVPKSPRRLPRPVEPEADAKFQQLLEETDDIFYQCILLLRHTGLRIHELLRLEFDCIQRDAKGRCALIVPPFKFSPERRVPLVPATVALIEKIQTKSLGNHNKKIQPKLLIISPNGRPARYEQFSAVMLELCAKLSIKKWVNLHAFRHTFATSLLNAGFPITSLKEVMGHKAINMSLLYAKVSQQKIHSEFSDALTRMSEKQIPKILESRSGGADAAFADLSALLAKSLDESSTPSDQKRIRMLRNRLAKFKMEFLKAR